ncbi:hypothetical protein TUMSATVNIG1_13830 [Vibrio nigripulchritudo]|uniref:hypothetical protein n=1 Tax=Vibrio nigripulchritudo TaxID=28173 RepID=UPI00190D11DD|nr:hypothetical protein [Vibrio nigripulchritudo]BCL69434.1 hypothetical protein VNTUMSATTG_13710 [Vibrio nigripulchritudo]BDU30774.1 hypothetical protein TUMSATVNIG1_13830 [Vibrio nigripulchritudo]
MSHVKLSETGNTLALEVDRLACDYHVKSDQYEILKWEADILRAKTKDLIEAWGSILKIRYL